MEAAAFELLCFGVIGIAWLIDHFFNDGKFFDDDEEDSTNAQKRPMPAKCSFDNCNSLAFRSSEYCWKHQEGKAHVTDGPSWWEEGGGVS